MLLKHAAPVCECRRKRIEVRALVREPGIGMRYLRAVRAASRRQMEGSACWSLVGYFTVLASFSSSVCAPRSSAEALIYEFCDATTCASVPFIP